MDIRDSHYKDLATTRNIFYALTTLSAILFGLTAVIDIAGFTARIILLVTTFILLAAWMFCSGRCIGYRDGLDDERRVNEEHQL